MTKRRKTTEKIIKSSVKECGSTKYSYNLTVSESEHVASYGIPLYSVKIEEYDEGGLVNGAVVKEMFVDPGRALAFYDNLVRRLAGPVDLSYILEEDYSN